MSVIEAVREGTAWTSPAIEVRAAGAGGAREEVDVDAVVGAFYARLADVDVDGPLVPDLGAVERWVRADARVLAGILATPAVVRPVAPGLLLTRPDLVRRHLGAALLATDLSRSAAMAAALAFTLATGHAVVLEAVRETGAPSGT
jgi:hypothetical protein